MPIIWNAVRRMTAPVTRLLVPTATTVLLCSFSLYGRSPPYVEAFVEGGGSFITGHSGAIPLVCIPENPTCGTEPVNGSFSKAGRIFAGLRVRATRRHAFEFGYSFSPNRLRVTEVSSSRDIGPGYNRVHNVNFNYVAYLLGRGPLQPFVTAGLGVNRFTQTDFTNGNQIGYNFGWGADISVVRGLAVRLELRDFLAAQPAPIRGTSHNVVPSAGVVIRFK